MTGARRWGLVVAAVTAVAVVGAVVFVLVRDDGTGSRDSASSSSAPRTTGATTTTATSSSTVTAPAPTAASDLAPFLSAAERADQQLGTAAAVVNGNLTADELRVDQETVDAVGRASDAVSAASAAVPAGLEPDLLRAVLLVQSDLESRSAALRPAAVVGSRPRSEVEPCFRNGSEAAARFAGDLADLVSLAEASSPVALAEPDSRAAEELAVRLRLIVLLNRGCDSCGGHLATDLSTVTFADTPEIDPGTGARWDGRIDDIPFRADFDAATGWKVELNAC